MKLELGQEQVGTEFEGKFILIKNGAPNSKNTGIGRGGWCINTAATGANDRMYVQVSSNLDSPSWKYISCDS